MSTRKFAKLATVTAGACALAVTLAACGSSGGSAKGANGGSGSSGVVVQAGQGTRLPGNYDALSMWGWVPNSLYPSDISESSSGSYNTNDSLTVNKTHELASMTCVQVLNYAGAPGYGEEAYLVDSGQNESGTNIYSYGAYEFPTAGEASAFVKAEASRFASCGSFSATESGTTVQATLSDGPASAAQVPAANTAADVRLTASAGGKANAGEMVLAADGNVVVIASSSTLGSASLPTEVQDDQIAEKLLAAFTTQEAVAVQASAGEASAGASGAATSPGGRIGGAAR